MPSFRGVPASPGHTKLYLSRSDPTERSGWIGSAA